MGVEFIYGCYDLWAIMGVDFADDCYDLYLILGMDFTDYRWWSVADDGLGLC